MNNTKYTRIKQLFGGVLIMAVSACSSNEKKETTVTIDSAISVTVASPLVSGQSDLQVSGQIEALQTANISTRMMGYITSMKVKTGDHVVKGQLIATISNDDIVAKRAQSDAAILSADMGVKNAQKDMERFNNLFKQQSATAKELDNVTLAYQMAKSQLESARQIRNEISATLKYTNLSAPFDGIVTQKLLDAGSMATPGMPLATIEKIGSYQVSVAIPENVVGLVKSGVIATVTISASDKVFKGAVNQISQSSQFTGGQYMAKVRVPDDQMQGLFSGMYANVSIPITKVARKADTEYQVLVPLKCIDHKNQLTGLYTIGSNNTALLRWVTLGKVVGDQVEVLSGLAPDEEFIVSATGRLFNGRKVNIKP